jgi:RNA polymerase sigma-70 factor, ECF subfamily
VSALAPLQTEQLYERHSRRIFGYCLRLLGSREDAEDAVQTTFINAQRGLGRGVTPQFELAWLFKIARNVCYNTRASASRRGRLESVRDLDSLQDALTFASPDRGAAISIHELSRALESIPERQRRALLLREFQGLSYEEIAAELGVTVAAVETLIFRARRSVAEQLEQSGATSHVGAFASIVAFLRWLLPGGGKVAAVAATATLAVTPGMRGPDAERTAPVIPPAAPPAASDATPAVNAPRAVVSRDVTPAAKQRPVAVVKEFDPAPVNATSAATTAPPPVQNTASPPPIASEVKVPPVPPATSEAIPDVTAPEITLPTVGDLELPSLEPPPLPVDVPQLPQVELPTLELPKLP